MHKLIFYKDNPLHFLNERYRKLKNNAKHILRYFFTPETEMDDIILKNDSTKENCML